MRTLEDARTILRNENVRLTPQRLMIAEVLTGHCDHPTVEQVYDLVRQQYPSISLATVYNTVTLLGRCGMINILHGGKDGLHLDAETAPHAHAYCVECGKIDDIPFASPVDLDRQSLSTFTSEQLEVSVFGRCARCAVASQ